MPKDRRQQTNSLEGLRFKLASRYEVSVSEFKEKFYVHLKDTQKEGRHFSLHSDGINALSKVLPKILKAINTSRQSQENIKERVQSSSEEEEDHVEPITKKLKRHQ